MNRSTELRHFLYRMLAVCALILLLQSYVITFLGITANGSYMKRGFARMFQVSTNFSSHVLYTVLATVFLLIILKTINYGKDFKN